MNVGIPNQAPSYHKATVEDYQRMSFVPTKANLEKRHLEEEQAALQDRRQGKRSVLNAARSNTDHDVAERKSSTDSDEDPQFITTSSLQSYPQPDIRRLSGNFNAPTQVEVNRHNETKRSFRGKIKQWMGKSPP